MSKKILIITEGPGDKQFIRRLFKVFLLPIPEIVTFKTNIYKLFEYYESYDVDFEDLDVKTVLLECRTDLNSGERKILDYEGYSDIFLIFDFEFQDPLFDAGLLSRFSQHFSDSTTYGRLVINYPMLESYRHSNKDKLMACEFDRWFFNKKIEARDLSSYKQIASDEGFSWSSKLKSEHVVGVINNHALKANFCVNQVTTLPQTFYVNLNQEFFKQLLGVQVEEVSKNKEIWVINSTYLVFGELYPQLIDLSNFNMLSVQN